MNIGTGHRRVDLWS